MKVSTIIPVWNRPKTLVRCLSSILYQTYNNFEIIVIGDGCNIEIENEYLNAINIFKDKRIKWYNLEKHVDKGWATAGAIARNFAISVSDGDIIAPIDDDDAWMPWHLQDCVEALKNKNIDIVYGKFYEISKNDTYIRGLNGEIGHLTVAYRSKFNNFKYEENGELASDWLMWQKFKQNNCKFHYIDKVQGIRYANISL